MSLKYVELRRRWICWSFLNKILFLKRERTEELEIFMFLYDKRISKFIKKEGGNKRIGKASQIPKIASKMSQKYLLKTNSLLESWI